MAADNRDELSGLRPGDKVTIESTPAALGLVVRVAGSHMIVSCQSPRRVRHVTHFARRDGVRIGGSHRAELENIRSADAVPAEQRRQMRRIDAPCRE
ncbi:hypothetical protein E4P39_03845 [Blastococcus sp. CT_GayMR19]|uniref:hypothetical protein n=1 Tax=Blastococcus sp. CT_GayMR19 TaxID=2559608 RepID=UPI00107304BF|nr:hypothetical protein [Blastococcus sp. CT_GayMR19]TFV78359.1 hypothetical protein E4P39_03845 [Blastococcus sp. CT_GayMR19]